MSADEVQADQTGESQPYVCDECKKLDKNWSAPCPHVDPNYREGFLFGTGFASNVIIRPVGEVEKEYGLPPGSLTLAEQEKKDGGCTDCGAKLWAEHSLDCPRRGKLKRLAESLERFEAANPIPPKVQAAYEKLGPAMLEDAKEMLADQRCNFCGGLGKHSEICPHGKKPKRVTGDNPISENPWARAERAEANLLAARAEGARFYAQLKEQDKVLALKDAALKESTLENESQYNTIRSMDKIVDQTMWQLFAVGFVAASIFWMIVYFVVLR